MSLTNKQRKPKPEPKKEPAPRASFGQYLKKLKPDVITVVPETGKVKVNRFIGFNERLKSMDVKLSHNLEMLPGKSEIESITSKMVPEDEKDATTLKQCHFIEVFNSQNMLNVTKQYADMASKLYTLTATFPLILNNLQEIVNILLSHLSASDPYFSESILDLIVALIRDMRQAIFPIFLQQIMPKLVELIRIDSLDLMDHLFKTFTFAFRFLHKQMMAEINKVYLCYFELIGHSNKFVRKFASESFSFIIRRFNVSEIEEKAIDILLDPVINMEKYIEVSSEEIVEPMDYEETKEITSKNQDLYEKIVTGPSQSKGNKLDFFAEFLDKFYFRKSRKTIKNTEQNRTESIISFEQKRNVIAAVGQLFSEIMQNTQESCHSKAKVFLVALIKKCLNLCKANSPHWVDVYYVIRFASIGLLDYIMTKYDNVIIESLLEGFQEILVSETCKGKTEDEDRKMLEEKSHVEDCYSTIGLELLLQIYTDFVGFRNGRKITEKSLTVIITQIKQLLIKSGSGCFPKMTLHSIMTLLYIIFVCHTKFFMVHFNESLSELIFNKSQPFNGTHFVDLLYTGWKSTLEVKHIIGLFHGSTEATELKIRLITKEALLELLDLIWVPFWKSTITSIIAGCGNKRKIDMTEAQLTAVNQEESLLNDRLNYVWKVAKVVQAEKVTLREDEAAKIITSLMENNDTEFFAAACKSPNKGETKTLKNLSLILALLAKSLEITLSPSSSLKEQNKLAVKFFYDIYTNLWEKIINPNFKESSSILPPFIDTYNPYWTYTSKLSNQAKYYFNIDKTIDNSIEDGINIFASIFRILAYSLHNNSISSINISDILHIYLSFITANPTLQSYEALAGLKHLLVLISENSQKPLVTTDIYKNNTSSFKLFSLRLIRNLASNIHDVRKISLELLLIISDSDSNGHKLLTILRKIDQLEVGLDTEKPKNVLFADAKRRLQGSHKFTAETIDAVIYYSFGCLWYKFSPLHSAAEELLESALMCENIEDGDRDIKIAKQDRINTCLKLFQVILRETKDHGEDLINEEEEETHAKSVEDGSQLLQEEHTDLMTYLISAFKLIKRVVKFVQDESLVKLFYVFICVEYNEFNTELRWLNIELRDSNIVVFDEQKVKEAITNTQKDLSVVQEKKKLPTIKLKHFLDALSSLPSSSDPLLYKTVLQILAHPDDIIQGFALDVMHLLNLPHINKYYKKLQNIISKLNCKEQLMEFTQGIPEKDSQVLVCIYQIIYGKLTKKKGKRTKSNKRDMTTQIFAFLTSLPEENMITAMILFMENIQILKPNEKWEEVTSTELKSRITQIPGVKLRGFCYLLKLIFKKMGHFVDKIIPIYGSIILNILGESISQSIKECCHEICYSTLKRIYEFYEIYNKNGEYIIEFTKQLIAIISKKISVMNLYNAQGKSTLLKLFLLWSSSADYMQTYFVKFPEIINSIMIILKEKLVTQDVAEVIINIMKNLLFELPSSAAETTVPRVCEAVIKNNIFTIISSFHHYFIVSHPDSELQKNKQLLAVMSELATFCHIVSTDNTENAELVAKITDIIMPIIDKLTYKEQKHEIEIIFALRALTNAITGSTSGKYALLMKFARLLLKFRFLTTRFELSRLLFSIAESCQKNSKVALSEIPLLNVDKVAKSCQKVLIMNTFKKKGINNELDYDLALHEINELNAELASISLNDFHLDHYLILFYHYISQLISTEFAIRSACIAGIKVYFERILTAESLIKDSTTKNFINEDLFSTLTNHINNAIKMDNEEIIIRGICEVFRSYGCFMIQITKKMPEDTTSSSLLYSDLANLCDSTNPENDFFETVMHTQLHKRFKAVRVATSKVVDNKISVELQKKILLPISNALLMAQEDLDEKMKKKILIYKKSGYARQIVTDTVELIGKIAAHLNEEDYFWLIMKKAKALKKSRIETSSNVLIQAICSILDNYPFSNYDAGKEINSKVNEAIAQGKFINSQQTGFLKFIKSIFVMKQPQIVIDPSVASAPVAMETGAASSVPEQSILIKLTKTVFPILKKGLHSEKNQNTNFSRSSKKSQQHTSSNPLILLALIRIINKMELPYFYEEYHRIVNFIAYELRSSKLFPVREEYRGILNQVVDISSPYVFYVIIDELSTALTQDYQRHILVYTLTSILLHIIKNKKEIYAKGNIDYCLDSILTILTKGVIGELAEDKESEEVMKQCKEAKNEKATEGYGCLAQLINIKTSLSKFLKPLLTELETTKSVKQINRVEQALHRISENILKNECMDGDTVISVCLDMITKGVKICTKNDEDSLDETSILKNKRNILSEQQKKEKNFTIQEGASGGHRVTLNNVLKLKRQNEKLSGKAIAIFGFSVIFNAISKSLIPLPTIINPSANHPGIPEKEEEEERKINAIMMEFEKEENSKPIEAAVEVMSSADTPDWLTLLVSNLLAALKTPFSQIVQLALKLYDKLLNRNIPAMQQHANEFLQLIINQFDYLNLNDQEMTTILFRCITHILQIGRNTITELNLAKPQMEALFELIKNNMSKASKEVQVFKCVRAILNSGLQLKKSEDIIDLTGELILTSIIPGIKDQCSKIFFEYTIRQYRKSFQKFSRQIQYILNNLSYDNEDSRGKLLLLLERIMNYTSWDNPNSKSLMQTIFLSLVLRISNEDSPKCKKQIVSSILENIIFAKCSKDVIKQILNTIMIWIKEGAKETLIDTCYLILGSAIKVLKYQFVQEEEGKFLLATLNGINIIVEKGILTQSQESEEEEQKGSGDTSKENFKLENINEEVLNLIRASGDTIDKGDPQKIKVNDEWKHLYMSLCCYEKLFEHVPNIISSKVGPASEMIAKILKNDIAQLIYHPHYWIKLISNRIIGHYFKICSTISTKEDEKMGLFKEDAILAKSEEEAKEEKTKSSSLQDLAKVLLLSYNSQHIDDSLATQLTKNLLYLAQNSPASSSLPTGILISACKMGRKCIARTSKPTSQLTYIAQLVGGLGIALSQEKLKATISDILSFLYRLATNENLKGSELRTLADDIMKVVENKVQTEFYVSELNLVKNAIENKRMERKNIEKRRKLVNPEKAEKIKEKRREKAKDRRHRLNEQYAARRRGDTTSSESKIRKKKKQNDD